MHYVLLASFTPTACTVTDENSPPPSEANKVVPLCAKIWYFRGNSVPLRRLPFTLPARRKSTGKQMSGPEHATGGMGDDIVKSRTNRI